MSHEIGYHFCRIVDGKPVLRDRRPLVIGEKLVHPGAPVMCNSGFHDSIRVIDALCHAPGSFLCRTQLSGTIIEEDDKRVASERVALVGADVTSVLREFALRVAYVALLADRERGREPDPRSWAALAATRAYLDSPTPENCNALKDASAGAYRSANASAAAYAAAYACDAYAAAYAAYAAATAAYAYAYAADAAADADAAREWMDHLLTSMLPGELQ